MNINRKVSRTSVYMINQIKNLENKQIFYIIFI